MRVLVVDDDEGIRRLLARYGAGQHWQVVTASNPQEALAAFIPGHFQMAFLDVDMGDDVDGIGLARKLRDLDPSLRVVMMSGDPANNSRIEAAKLGPMLAKPFELSALEEWLYCRNDDTHSDAYQLNSRDKPTVLLVEDDPAQLADYTTMLEGSGYRVRSAASAEDGIALTQSHRVDVILTDNVLPGMTGLRSIAEFAKCSQAPVLVMTSDSSADVEKDALMLGAKGCFKKPLDFVLLRQEIRQAIDNNAIEPQSKSPPPGPSS